MKRGIDVSVNNGTINWREVRRSGIDFAYIKASQGHLTKDPSVYLFEDRCFKYNITNAYSNGIDVGVYHFLTARDVTEAREEAQFFVSIIEPYRRQIKLHAVVDVESDKYLPKSRNELTAVVDTFCEIVESSGFDVMVYTNPNYLKNKFNNRHKLWLALWRDESNIPTSYDAEVWQYSETGRVDGVSGNVDMNLYLKVDEIMHEPTITPSDTVAPTTEFDNTPADWAREDVEWCVDNGILYGDGTGNLRLHEPFTREMAAVFAHRICKYLRGEV